jgi:transposase
MDCDGLRDDQWERLKPFIPGGRKGKRGPRSDGRRFLDVLLWMAPPAGVGATCRTGSGRIRR